MKRVTPPATEPGALTTFRSAMPHGTWDDARAEKINEPVFDALAAVQGHLCAYCEIAIRRPLFGQVEHYLPKSRSAVGVNLHLDFANMLACCEGGTRLDMERSSGPGRAIPPVPETQHCGQLKLARDPIGRMLHPVADVPAHPCLWRIDSAGRIEADPEACAAAGVPVDRARDTLDFLGLDRRGLRRLRAAVVSALDDAWQDAVPEGADDAEWEAARLTLAKEHLLPVDDRLPAFWSTIRSWAGAGIEAFLLGHADRIPGLS